MANSIRDYVSENVSVSYDQIRTRFGDPQIVATAYVNEMVTEEILENLQLKRRALGIITIAVTIVTAVWLVSIIVGYVDHVKNMDGYAVVEVIEVGNTPEHERRYEK